MPTIEEQLIAEGEAKVLLKQLTLRFGPLPARVRERLEGATTVDLERWAERVLTAATLEDVVA